jgi:hypothetical protein
VGCEGFGPSTILGNYWDDPVAQENALQDFISTHVNSNPYNDPLLDHTAKVMVVNTSFRVRANDPEQYGWQVAPYGVAAAAAAMVFQGESGRQLAFPFAGSPQTVSNPAFGSGRAYTIAYEMQLPPEVTRAAYDRRTTDLRTRHCSPIWRLTQSLLVEWSP